MYRFSPINVPALPRWLPAIPLYLFPLFASRLRLDAYDVLHTHGDDHFLRTRRPLVRTFYGSSLAEARYSTKLRHRLYHLSMVVPERLSERGATARVAISAFTQRYLKRPSIVIPCGYDPAEFFPAGVKSGTPSILFVGDLGTRKRAELLLTVFSEIVRPAVPAAELWMVTTQPVTGAGVRWFGRVPTETLADLYCQAWIFCLPSRYEGFGVPYIEAMACGTPVVATPNGGAEEILDYGRYGRLVQEGELGHALVELLSSEEVRCELAARGLERAKRYDIALVAERYETVYKEAIAQWTRERFSSS